MNLDNTDCAECS